MFNLKKTNFHSWVPFSCQHRHQLIRSCRIKMLLINIDFNIHVPQPKYRPENYLYFPFCYSIHNRSAVDALMCLPGLIDCHSLSFFVLVVLFCVHMLLCLLSGSNEMRDAMSPTQLWKTYFTSIGYNWAICYDQQGWSPLLGVRDLVQLRNVHSCT